MIKQDYTEQHSMPPWCETHDGPRGGRGAENCSVCFDEQPQLLPARLRALDLDYYRLVVETQGDPKILKQELSDLIDEIVELEKEANNDDNIS